MLIFKQYMQRDKRRNLIVEEMKGLQDAWRECDEEDEGKLKEGKEKRGKS